MIIMINRPRLIVIAIIHNCSMLAFREMPIRQLWYAYVHSHCAFVCCDPPWLFGGRLFEFLQ